MTVKKFRSIHLLVAFCVFGACSCEVVPAAQPEPPTTKPSGELAQYYGFAEMEILKLQMEMGTPIVADINHDGLNDLVVTNNRKARIELLLQKKDFKPGQDVQPVVEDEDINDIFGKERNWRFKRASYDLDVAATSCMVADLNHDGLLDLGYYATPALYIALQEAPKRKKPEAPRAGAKDSAPREPLFRPAKKIDIPEGLDVHRALTGGDLNGDGRTDLALLGSDGAFLILQKPDGALGQPVKYPSSGKQLRQLDIVDLNGDGRADLSLLTGDRDFPLRVRFQTPAGKLGPEVRLRFPAPAVLEFSVLGKSPESCVLAVPARSGRFGMWVLKSDDARSSYPVFTYPLPGTESAGKRDMVAPDVDGDGRLDVVVSDPSRAEFLLFRATEKTSLSAPERFPGLMDMQKLCAGDLDGTKKDSIVALSIEEKLVGITRLEDGRLKFPVSVEVKGEPQAIDLADANSDGKLDLIYVGREKKDDKYFLRTVWSVGTSKAEHGLELALSELKDKPLDLRAADIDHDGRTDVMVLRPYGPLLLIRQAEPGKFSQVPERGAHAGLVANIDRSSLSIAPLGPKGTTAILLAQKRFARSLFFDAEKGWTVVDQYPPGSPRSNVSVATACRFPGQTDLTVVTYDASREKLGILSRQPDGTYRTTREVEIGAVSGRKILTGNFGGPVPLSLLVCGTHKLVRVPLAERTVQLAKIAGFEPDIKDSRFGALTVGDVNSDGFPDVVLCDQARHHVEILAFNPKGRLVVGTKFKVFEQPRSVERSYYPEGRGRGSTQPRSVTVGDVTGDGKPDVVLQVHDRIIIYPQD